MTTFSASPNAGRNLVGRRVADDSASLNHFPANELIQNETAPLKVRPVVSSRLDALPLLVCYLHANGDNASRVHSYQAVLPDSELCP